MVSRWIAALTVVASVTAGSFAVAAAAADDSADVGPFGAPAGAVAPVRPAAAPPAPSAVPGGGPGEGRVSEQTISVEVRGGTLSVSPSTATVEMRHDGDEWHGELGGITVVDARGSLEGWSLELEIVEVRVDGSPAGEADDVDEVEISAHEPVVVHGIAGEVVRGDDETLLEARPGGGGGTFVGGATIELDDDDLDDLDDARAVTVTVALTAR